MPSLRNKIRRICLSLTLAAPAVATLPAAGLADDRQYKIEAAYLYSFFNYITWPGLKTPQELTEPTICIYENDPILPYLEYIQAKTGKERTLTLQAITAGMTLKSCHILFMRHRLLSSEMPEHTLTVFRPDDPLDRGGMIELSEEGEHIAIKINQSQLELHGFSISSRLLDLAQRVR